MVGSVSGRVSAVLVACLLCGCAGLPLLRDGSGASETEDERRLSAIIAELYLHLGDDTYRYDRSRTEGRQDVFALALWRLDRLRTRRGDEPEAWDNLDLVIEYGRARALERLRRYSEAGEAYRLVADRGSRLGEPARIGALVMQEFARHSGPPADPAETVEERLELIESRIRVWERLAHEHRSTLFEPLAREEVEAWDMMRIDWLARHRSTEEAVGACRRAVERHHASKLHATHLIRLGNLYAEAAHGIYARARARLARFDAEKYEDFLDHALSAYEAAGERAGGSVRAEADGKIEALLARHEGVRAHVP